MDNTSDSTIITLKYTDFEPGFEIGLFIRNVSLYLTDPTGIIASILIILTIQYSKSISKTFKLYLSAVAFADGLRLTFSMVNVILSSGNYTDWTCKLAFFMAYFNSIMSDSLVMVMSVERTIAVMIPHKIKIISTKGKAIGIITSVMCLSFLVSSAVLITVRATHNRLSCYRIYGTYPLLIKIFNLSISVLAISIFFIILVCSILIIFKLTQMSKVRSNIQSRDQNNNNKQITFMLLSIAVAYVLTTMPIISLELYKTTRYGSIYGNLFWINDLFYFLKELGHALNFFLYCASSSIFRKTFMDMLHCRSSQ